VVTGLPLIDVTQLRAGTPGRHDVAERIDRACRDHGLFRVVGHGVPGELRDRLDAAARDFFARPNAEKAAIAMVHGGRAWRGWFPVGGELTSGRPDRKEGIYFGTELAADHPAVRAGRPLHGPNLFPDEPATLRRAVLDWMAAMTELGRVLLGGVALGLGLPEDWFAHHVTAEPTVLFRIFHYPPGDDPADDGWGVGEHTDYGLLTILAQDRHAGLQVRRPGGWIDVPAEPDVLVVNLGDMLDKMTAGRYHSTAHRVRNTTNVGRLSFPCFIDPSWDARCTPIPLAGAPATDDPATRWDGTSLHAWDGIYGDYLTAKVAKVFPELFASVSGAAPTPDRARTR
jgi:isopenicillin N synthase-like dioxygenase